MKFFRFIVLLLVIVGALNWGLWGFFKYDFIQDLVGTGAWARICYSIIGLAGLYGISFFFSKGVYGSRVCHKHEEHKEE